VTDFVLNELGPEIQRFFGMLRIRRVEEALADEYGSQEMRCPMHLSIGQEAIAVGVCGALNLTDLVMSNHRGHAHYIAKGGSLNAMFAELYGRSTGCAGGRGGSMHLIDKRAGFMGSAPIVGGTIPIAVGLAWSARLRNSNQVATVFFGDACFEEGVVHESMIFSSLHRLPILFICENNEFSVYTHLKDRQPNREIWRIAEAHSIRSRVGDGNDIHAVWSMASEAVRSARSGEGPQFLEFTTYRWREHCGPNFDNELGYRSPENVRAGEGDCPIAREKKRLLESGDLSEGDVSRFEDVISREIGDAFDFAKSSPWPSPNSLLDYVWGGQS